MAEKKKRDFEPMPYYRWYWRDWRSSRSVGDLHYVARGLYRELLDECWAKGFIPDDPAQLARICGCPLSVMKTHWPALASFFVFVKDGMYVNERIENERSDSDKLRAERSRNGMAGASKRWQKMATDSKSQQPLANDGTLLSSSTSSSNSKSSSGSQDLPAVAALAPQEARGDAAVAGFASIRDVLKTTGAAPIGFRTEGEQ
jgi:uncharacterized protein YdaU (DUF1376 family)